MMRNSASWRRARAAMPVMFIAFALVLTACGSSGKAKTSSSGSNPQPASLGTIRVVASVAQTFQYIPVTLGEQLGVWAKRGLKVTNVAVQGGSKSVQLLASGDADIELGSGPTDVTAITQGLSARIVGAIGLDFSPLVLVVPEGSSITSAADLKGKVVGVTSKGSLTDVAVQQLEQKMGWSANSVKEATVGGLSEQLAALKSGSTQAFVWTAEAGYELQAKNEGKVVFNFGQYFPKAVFQNLTATTSIIQKNPAAVKAFLAGWYEAANYMVSHKDQVLPIVEKLFAVTPTVATQIYDNEIGGLATQGAIPAANLTGLANLVAQSKGTKALATSAFYDGSLLPAS